MTAPIVKWAGGKTRLLPELVKRMPEKYGTYHEPFVGGGALFFHLQPQQAILNDLNGSLISLYQMVRHSPERVIRFLRHMAKAYAYAAASRHPDERVDFYADMRNRWNYPRLVPTPNRRDPAYRAALMLFLNRTCFNGLWRENSKGEFNTPIGDCVDPGAICDAMKIRVASATLAGARLLSTDYASASTWATRGDFVYFDPPYEPASSTASFTAYTGEGFGRHQQEHLAERACELVEGGVQVMLSNADVPVIRKLYSSFKLRKRSGRTTPVFTIHRIRAPRSISANGKKRQSVGELVITGGY